ncbi:hypothetical protein HN011_004509 [Eciton burchellii]|nr:hypothetical protein HN011_004509 [Eciton burchellii]
MEAADRSCDDSLAGFTRLVTPRRTEAERARIGGQDRDFDWVIDSRLLRRGLRRLEPKQPRWPMTRASGSPEKGGSPIDFRFLDDGLKLDGESIFDLARLK